MSKLLQSASGYLKGIWIAAVATVSAIADPLVFAKSLGFVSPDTEWTIGAEAMRLIFIGIALGSSFWWYHKTRDQYERANPEPNLPLHLACRWIAKNSVWAARYDRRFDQEWVSNVDDELMSKVLQGKVELFGRLHRPGASTQGPLRQVAPVFKDSAQWNSHHLTGSEPPTHMWQSSGEGGRVYYNVMLDAKQVRRVWPRRSLWAALHRRSPIERIGNYDEVFATQDAYYKEQAGFAPAPLEAIV